MRTVVGVLRGGPSSEYEVSLKTGASVLEALDREKYEPRDIFISRSGEWHAHGVAMEPEKALKGIDVAFVAMHGEFGEDGRLQRQLDALGVPYTGSDAFASSLAFYKVHTKNAGRQLGGKIAHGPGPGARGGGAAGGVVDDFGGERAYALMPVEITPPPHQPFFNYEAKYSGETTERCPGNFSDTEKGELERIAKVVHEGLSLAHYSRSDFIVSKRGIYFLEVNTLPGLTQESLLPKALRAVGSSLAHFLDHVISLARTRR